MRNANAIKPYGIVGRGAPEIATRFSIIVALLTPEKMPTRHSPEKCVKAELLV
jgi:hypothetical protein